MVSLVTAGDRTVLALTPRAALRLDGHRWPLLPPTPSPNPPAPPINRSYDIGIAGGVVAMPEFQKTFFPNVRPPAPISSPLSAACCLSSQRRPWTTSPPNPNPTHLHPLTPPRRSTPRPAPRSSPPAPAPSPTRSASTTTPSSRSLSLSSSSPASPAPFSARGPTSGTGAAPP